MVRDVDHQNADGRPRDAKAILMLFELSDLGEEFALRATCLNGAPIREGARYVMCWLQQTLRGHDHPTIDAAVALGNRLGDRKSVV